MTQDEIRAQMAELREEIVWPTPVASTGPMPADPDPDEDDD